MPKGNERKLAGRAQAEGRVFRCETGGDRGKRWKMIEDKVNRV